MNQFYTLDLQIIGVTVQNVFGVASWRPIFVHPRYKDSRQFSYLTN